MRCSSDGDWSLYEMTTGEKIYNTLTETPVGKIIAAALIVVLTFLIYKLLIRFLASRYQKITDTMADSARTRTYFKLAKSAIRYGLLLFVVLTVLSVFGVNLSSLLTGVGLFAVVIGFVIQDALKDIIRGTTIVADKFFSVGDVVVYGGITGEVISFGLASTKIRDLDDNSVLAIANRRIEEIKVLTELQLLRLPVPYDEDTEKVKEVMLIIDSKVKEQPDIKDFKYEGANHFKDSFVEHLLKYWCDPAFRDRARRQVLKVIIEEFDKAGISIPFNQLDVHLDNKNHLS